MDPVKLSPLFLLFLFFFTGRSAKVTLIPSPHYAYSLGQIYVYIYIKRDRRAGPSSRKIKIIEEALENREKKKRG